MHILGDQILNCTAVITMDVLVLLVWSQFPIYIYQSKLLEASLHTFTPTLESHFYLIERM